MRRIGFLSAEGSKIISKVKLHEVQKEKILLLRTGWMFIAVLSGQFSMPVRMMGSFRRVRPHVAEDLIDRIFKFFGLFASTLHIASALVVCIIGQIGVAVVVGRDLTQVCVTVVVAETGRQNRSEVVRAVVAAVQSAVGA